MKTETQIALKVVVKFAILYYIGKWLIITAIYLLAYLIGFIRRFFTKK